MFAAPSGSEAALAAQQAGLEPLRVVEAIPSRKGEREIETGTSRRPGRRDPVRRRRPWCGRTAADAVRTCCGDARRDDTGRLLEHRGPVRDRPSRPRRSLRARELRHQVPGRGGRVHGHRPRSHLRRRGGDRGRLRPYAITLTAPAASSRRRRAIATAAYETLVGLQPTLRLERAAGDPQRRLHGIHGRRPRRRRQERRGRGRGAGRTGRARQARKRRPGAEPDRRRPEPAARGTWRLATESPVPVLGLRLPGVGRSRSGALRSSAPTAPMRSPARSTPTTSTRSSAWGASTAPPGRPSRRSRRASGPTTTSGSGTTACSVSPPPGGSTSYRRRGCWPWRTWRAATR